MHFQRRPGRNIFVKDNTLVRAPSAGGGGGPPLVNLEAQFASSAVTFTGSAVDTWPDGTGNGHDATATGTKATLTVVPATAIPAVTWGAGAAPYSLASPIVKPGTTAGGAQAHTVYNVFYGAGGSPVLNYFLDDSANRTRIVWRFSTAIHLQDGGGIVAAVVYSTGSLLVARWRYSPAGGFTDIIGVGTGSPATGIATDTTYDRLAGTAAAVGLYWVDCLVYNEDTVVSGQDAAVLAYFTATYGT